MRRKLLVGVVIMAISIATVITLFHMCRSQSGFLLFKTNSVSSAANGAKKLFVFTGRWKFLRVALPYIYRDLRKNGGVLDAVFFMMVNYDSLTHEKLKNFATFANKAVGEKVFELHYLGCKPGHPPGLKKAYALAYYEMFADLINSPYNQYLKVDDDVVYYHPDAFRNMFEKKNSSQCFMHFGNIAGTNWRCSITHQRMGLFNNTEVNPKHFKFDYQVFGKCGWKSPDCASVTLDSFLYYYRHQQLGKYMFKGLELLHDRKRFSINFHLLDKDLIRMKEMLEVGSIRDDEAWWTQKLAPKRSIKQPNCIVGEALVVHFSYFTTTKEMLESGYLINFEEIAMREVGLKIPQEVWNVLEYYAIILHSINSQFS